MPPFSCEVFRCILGLPVLRREKLARRVFQEEQKEQREAAARAEARSTSALAGRRGGWRRNAGVGVSPNIYSVLGIFGIGKAYTSIDLKMGFVSKLTTWQWCPLVPFETSNPVMSVKDQANGSLGLVGRQWKP